MHFMCKNQHSFYRARYKLIQKLCFFLLLTKCWQVDTTLFVSHEYVSVLLISTFTGTKYCNIPIFYTIIYLSNESFWVVVKPMFCFCYQQNTITSKCAKRHKKLFTNSIKLFPPLMSSLIWNSVHEHKDDVILYILPVFIFLLYRFR